MSGSPAVSRILTLVFSDLAESTAAKARRGDIEVAELLARHQAHVSRLARDCSGRVIDWAGDGCFLTFETSASGVVFALRLQQVHAAEPDLLGVRIGLHMGEVSERTTPDGDGARPRVEGLAVDVAARICALARPGQVLMSAVVQLNARQRLPEGALGQPIVWQSYGDYALKGVREAVGLAEVGIAGVSVLTRPVADTGSRAGLTLSDHWKLVAAGLVLLLGIGVVLGGVLSRAPVESASAKRARKDLLPRLAGLVEDGRTLEAFAVAVELEKIIPDDPILARLLPRISVRATIDSDPPNAWVARRLYADTDSAWEVLGRAPIETRVATQATHRYRLELPGYESREFAPMFDEGSDGVRLHYQLARAKGERAGMVAVSVGPFSMQVVDLSLSRIEVPDFYIDHSEVTNREFKEFVDAGGYQNPRFWVHEFRRAGKRLTFDQAVASFTDQAGRAGPAGWVLGNYAEGAGDFPVGGVSWYEAAAYAEFRGKSLPTIFHWFAAAWPTQDPSFAFAASLIPQSNFSGALAAGGVFQGIGAQGAVDLVGNVREWSATPTGDSQYSLGGAFSDPTYFATQQTAQSPWDRLPENGLRCVSYLPDHLPDAKLFAPLDRQIPDFASVTPLTDEQFATTKEFFSYDPSPLNATLERVETPSNWRLELVTLDTPYGGGRAAVRLYLPPSGRPPFEPVVFFPGIHAFLTPAFEPWVPEEWSFIPRSGRALVVPIVDGTWERGRGNTLARLANPRSRTELLRRWVMDVGRTLDYLEARPDIDAKHAIFLGFSLGGSLTPVALAFEDRFVGAISLSGGLSTPFGAQLARRVHIPLLMLNGRHDSLFPVQTRQQAMYDLWGAPAPLKRHVIYESGHVPPRGLYLREMLDWLDRIQPTH